MSGSKWGGHCRKCGHPASYHGMTFCQVQAGATHKKKCDCDGYDAPYCNCGWTGKGNHYHYDRLNYGLNAESSRKNLSESD